MQLEKTEETRRHAQTQRNSIFSFKILSRFSLQSRGSDCCYAVHEHKETNSFDNFCHSNGVQNRLSLRDFTTSTCILL